MGDAGWIVTYRRWEILGGGWEKGCKAAVGGLGQFMMMGHGMLLGIVAERGTDGKRREVKKRAVGDRERV